MSRANAISMRLLEFSRKHGVNHQLLLIRFFHERLLYRLSVSAYQNKLLLKGGNLLYTWQGMLARPTVDIDFAGRQLSNEVNKIKDILISILEIEVEDEVQFDSGSLTVTEINEQNEYAGLRVKVMASLGNIRQNLQIDIGYGDVVTPQPIQIDYPIVLDGFPQPRLLAYTVETVIAEKLQAMIALAQLNSRMKDFYDVYVLIKNQPIDKEILKSAIEQTFENRHTPLDFNSVVFSREFIENQQRNVMWNAYLKKINAVPITFEEVIQSIKSLVAAIFNAEK